eukprot:Rmarinus@m.2327
MTMLSRLKESVQRKSPIQKIQKAVPSLPASDEGIYVPPQHYEYIILGGGVAAGYAVEQFVNSGIAPRKLCVISSESVPPYERPALTKGFLISSVRLPTFYTCAGRGGQQHDFSWYDSHGVSLALNTTIIKSKIEEKILVGAAGERFSYDRLIIATGLTPNPLDLPDCPGIDLVKGVTYFKSLSDAENVDSLIERGGSVVLVGGGFLSMELGAVLQERGMHVHIVYRGATPLTGVLPAEIAKHYAIYYESRGVAMREQAHVTSVRAGPDGRVEAVAINAGGAVDEEIPCSLVIVAIGSRPACEMFRGQLDMTVTGHITVGPGFRTSCPGVYAIGACCSFPSAPTGDMRIDSSVTHARASACLCAQGIMEEKVLDYPYFRTSFSRIFFSLRWKLIGSTEGDSVIVGNFDPTLLVWWVKQNRLVGAFLESGTEDELNLLIELVKLRPEVEIASLKGRSIQEVYQRYHSGHVVLKQAPEQYRFVVLGGGVAAGYAAKEMMECRVAANELCIVSKEPFAPYERPALSKGYLITGVRLPNFHTCVGVGGTRQNRKWYEDNGIALKTNTEVVKIDFQAKMIYTKDGKRLQYRVLLIATGVSCKRLKVAQIPGVHYLRDLKDTQAIVDQAEFASSCVVVGGGYIGMEVAAGLRERGLEVTMVLNGTHVMPMLFTEGMADHYMEFYKARGVRFVKKSTNVTFVADERGRLSGVEVRTSEDHIVQTLQCDMCVVGIGAEPDLSLYEEGLRCTPFGIEVDKFMRTSQGGVYAIGDIAAFPLSMEDGAMVRMEHVTHARMSAAHAVRHIIERNPNPYEYLPFFYSRLFSTLSWKCYGLARGTSVMCGDFKPKLWVYFVRNNAIVGVFMESGSEAENDAVKEIASHRPIISNIEDLHDMSVTAVLEKFVSKE